MRKIFFISAFILGSCSESKDTIPGEVFLSKTDVQFLKKSNQDFYLLLQIST